MRGLILLSLIGAAGAGCASNNAADEPGARIRDDSTATAVDTANPNDTLTHIRDTVPDSTSR
jgi:hypothetical protein